MLQEFFQKIYSFNIHSLNLDNIPGYMHEQPGNGVSENFWEQKIHKCLPKPNNLRGLIFTNRCRKQICCIEKVSNKFDYRVSDF